jgi:hypothetical protein
LLIAAPDIISDMTLQDCKLCGLDYAGELAREAKAGINEMAAT